MNEILRHELKHVVPLEQATNFFNSCLPYCHADLNADDFLSYEVSSLYYDTQSLRFYHDREESVGYRRKIRLRTYNLNDNLTAAFFEIKEKHKNQSNKKRLRFKNCDFLNRYRNYSQLTIDECLQYADDSSVSRELIYLNTKLCLYPLIIVRYLRRTLIPDSDSTLRITVDQRLTTGGSTLVKYDFKKEKFFLPHNMAIVEIKSNQHIPLWLQTLLLKAEFAKVRYSKYCEALKYFEDKKYPPLSSATKFHNSIEHIS